MNDIELKIETIRTSELVPYAGNAKEHPAEQVEQIAESMREFGNCDPIAVWTNANGEPEIIEGHGRLLALQKLGVETVPVIYLDHLTDEQRRAYVHVHNQTTLSSGFDMEVLEREMEALRDFDWGVFGFDELEKIDGPENLEFKDSEVPEEAPTRCKLGDVWMMGEHRLVCGDSTDPSVWEALMQGEQADLLLSDPPYNVDIHGGSQEALTIQNDNLADAEFQSLLDGFMQCSYENMKPGAAFYIWHASRTQRQFEDAINKAGLEVKQQIIWNKSSLVLGRQDYQWKHEPCLYGWKDGASHYFVDDRTLTTVWGDREWKPAKATKAELVEFAEAVRAAVQTDVWDFRKPSRSEDHPTMKPVPLMGRSIANSTRRGDIVVDPFGGSGSTLIACEQAGRRCRMVELDPHYCDVILRRWEEETGLKAVRLSG